MRPTRLLPYATLAVLLCPPQAYAVKFIVDTRNQDTSHLPRWDDTYRPEAAKPEAMPLNMTPDEQNAWRKRHVSHEITDEQVRKAVVDALQSVEDKKAADAKAAKEKADKEAAEKAEAEKQASQFGPIGGLGPIGTMGDGTDAPQQ